MSVQKQMVSSSQMPLSKLLEIRALKKAKTPKFQRQESWRYVRIHEPWRKPKGVDSHMRLSVKGWPALVKIGHRGPKAVRGLHPSGYRDVLVHNLSELEALSPEADAARLAAAVGRRKKIELAKRAKELKIRVLNGGGLLTGVDVATVRESEKDEKREQKEVSESEPAKQGEAAGPLQDEKSRGPPSSAKRKKSKPKRSKKSQKEKSDKKAKKSAKKSDKKVKRKKGGD